MANPKVDFSGSRVASISKAIENLDPLLKKIGAFMVRQTQAGFRDQRRGTTRWAPRRVPNVPGALRDLANGPSIKSRRFDDRPALVDTGRLRQSITFRLFSRSGVQFGTNLQQAKTMNFGGVSEIAVTAKMRENLAAWLRKQKGERKREMRESFGWVFSHPVGDRIKFSVKKREFVTITKGDWAFIQVMTRKHFKAEHGP